MFHANVSPSFVQKMFVYINFLFSVRDIFVLVLRSRVGAQQHFDIGSM